MSVSCGCTLCRRLAEESTRPQQPTRARAAGMQRRGVSDTLRAVAEEAIEALDNAGYTETAARLRARLEEVDRG